MRFVLALAFALLLPAAHASTLAEARNAYEAGNYAEAIRLATEAEPTDKTGEALLILSWIYRNGRGGVPSDQGKALELMRRAADMGHAPAMGALGMIYFDGDGVEKNIETARQLWLKAAAKGDPVALANLSYLYTFVDRNYPEAIVWLRRTIDKGDEAGVKVALLDLAALYERGQGVPKNMTEAVNLTRRAAIAGNMLAYSKMVEHYVNGTGVPQDAVRAQMWALIAERKGGGISPEGRGYLDGMLTPEKRAEAERLAAACLADAKACK
ncbi:MAG: tetratricopeptide repeat protein [Micropepsaceae bacterium]